jgi:hypothetical protein
MPLRHFTQIQAFFDQALHNSLKNPKALRLQPSLLDEARRIAQEEGVALNQLINVAVAEKLSAIRTKLFFRERARRANFPEAIEILGRTGKGAPPVNGDEVPESEKVYPSGAGRRERVKQVGTAKPRARSEKS